MSFVGDVLPCNLDYTIGFGNYNKINISLNNSKNVNEQKPNIFFANLESPILQKANSSIPFSGNPKIIRLFQNYGINIVSIANNHILEQGIPGFYETISLLRDNGIRVIGINDNNTSNIETFNIGNKIISFAGFNGIHDISNPGLYARLTMQGIDLAIQRMNEMQSTFKILSVHWGNEYISLPNPEQIQMAHFAIEKGCDLIIGHHPHVVQRIEVIRNKHIFYSLGNAYFDYLFAPKVKKGIRVDCVLSNNDFMVEYYFISSQNIGFKKIEDDTAVLLLSEKELKWQRSIFYDDWFYKKLKKIRFIYRLKMKSFLIGLFFQLPISNKLTLIKNIKRVIISKIFR